MATDDVPGANPQNRDVLAMGAWAEHVDGSLIFVKGTENAQVVYEMFDMAEAPDVVSYTDAMTEGDIKKHFSYPPTGQSKEKWTWHDKTPFPWSRVMQQLTRPRPSHATAEGLMSAARRVAQSLNLRGRRVAAEDVAHQTDQHVGQGRTVLERLQDAFDTFVR